MQKRNYPYRYGPDDEFRSNNNAMILDPELELEDEDDVLRETESSLNYDSEMSDELEFDDELNSEFDMNSEFDDEENYAMESEFDEGNELESAFDNEDDSEIDDELDDESDYEFDDETSFETDNESEFDTQHEDDFESELEEELPYINSEKEMEDLVNEIAVRDHRTRQISRTPIGRAAVRKLSKIGYRTLKGIGSAKKHLGTRQTTFLRKPPKVPIRRPSPRPQYNSVIKPKRRSPNIVRWNWLKKFPRYRNGYVDRNVYNYPLYPPNYDHSSQYDPGIDPSSDQDTTQSRPSGFVPFVLNALKNLAKQNEERNGKASPADQVNNAIIPAAAESYPMILQPKANAEDDMPTGDESGTESMQNEFDEEIYETEIFDEATEMELASELLSVNDDRELDYFLDGLFKKAKGFLKSNSGKALKGMLRKIAKKALPVIGTAAGGFFGGPLGASAGSKLGSMAAGMFELDLEGLSGEDQDFETAKAYIRFAGKAASQIGRYPSDDPMEDAKLAVIHAAREYAPGILKR